MADTISPEKLDELIGIIERSLAHITDKVMEKMEEWIHETGRTTRATLLVINCINSIPIF